MYVDKENNSVFLIQKLNNIKQKLNSDLINLSDLKREFDSFEQLKQEENFSYLEDLLDPINRKGVKIPSKMPVATCSFQLHNTYNVYTNNFGLNISVVNPFCLSSISVGETIPYANGEKDYSVGNVYNISAVEIARTVNYSWVYDDSGKIGENVENNLNAWDPIYDASFSIPPVYSKFRVVSGCLQLKYVGPLEESCGSIGGGIILGMENGVATQINLVGDNDRKSSFLTEPPSDIVQWSMVNNIRKLTYSIENNANEGVRLLYFPIDNSAAEFYPVLTKKQIYCKRGYQVGNRRINVGVENRSFFSWIFYIYKGPISKKNYYKAEFWINYECIPDPKLLNYIPISINVWKIPEWKISELAKVMEKHAVTAIKKMSAIDYFIA